MECPRRQSNGGERDRLADLRIPDDAFRDLEEAAAALLDVPVARVWISGEQRCDPLDQREGFDFYCGFPIEVDAVPVGTLYVADTIPRYPNRRQVQGLAALARQAATLISGERNKITEEMLRSAAEASFDTFFVLSPIVDEAGALIDFRFEYLQEKAAGFFGTPPGSLIGQPLLGSFATDSVRHYLTVFARVFETREPFETEYFSRMSANVGRWTRIKVVRAGDRLAIIGQDVHERREAEEAMRSAKAKLSATFDAVQVGILVSGPNGQIIQSNPAASAILEGDLDSIGGEGRPESYQTFHESGPRMLAAERPMARALRGETVWDADMRLRWPDGHERKVRANARPLYQDDQMEPYAAVCSLLDVSLEIGHQARFDELLRETAHANITLEAQRYQLVKANERLACLATTDGLTGLRNHRTFQERLEEELNRSARTGAPLSIALLDVDRFKAFNDEYGHQAGDAVLRGVASALESTVRQTDLAARYGGEEFVVIMPETDSASALVACERLRTAIEGLEWSHREVTASFGVATWSRGLSREKLIEAADRALYESKRAGRNQVTLAKGEPTMAVVQVETDARNLRAA